MPPQAPYVINTDFKILTLRQLQIAKSFFTICCFIPLLPLSWIFSSVSCSQISTNINFFCDVVNKDQHSEGKCCLYLQSRGQAQHSFEMLESVITYKMKDLLIVTVIQTTKTPTISVPLSVFHWEYTGMFLLCFGGEKNEHLKLLWKKMECTW